MNGQGFALFMALFEVFFVYQRSFIQALHGLRFLRECGGTSVIGCGG
jgi:hypothetical protein